MSDENCPYCGAEVEINHDDGHGYEEDQTHAQECVCGKTFAFTTAIHFCYSLKKCPCMNGADHEWKDDKYMARQGFPKWRHCIDCGETERGPYDETHLQSALARLEGEG